MPDYLGEPSYQHGTPDRLGVLLVNLGTPDGPDPGSVRRFLAQFLWDPRVVEAPRWLWWLALHGVILRIRPSKSAHAYQQIWTPTGSPLLIHTRALTERVADALEEPAAARRLLKEAGYPGGNGLPPVTLGYNTDEEKKLVAEAIQSMWQEHLGVIVKLENQEWKVFLKKLQTNPFPVFRSGWGADYPDPDNFMKLFTSNSGNNHGRWKNARFDQLLDSAARESDPQKRAKLYDEAQKLMTEVDAAIVPLYWKTEATMLNPKFTGLEYNSMARMDLRNVKPATK